MPSGLRIWNSSGVLIQDISDRLGRLFAEYTVPAIAYPNSYTISVPGYALDGNWFWAPYKEMPSGLSVVESAGSIRIQNTYAYSTGSFVLVVFRVG